VKVMLAQLFPKKDAILALPFASFENAANFDASRLFAAFCCTLTVAGACSMSQNRVGKLQVALQTILLLR
jgi:hypothetical protein